MKQYFDVSISFRASEDNLPAQRESSTESSQYLSTGESVRESQHRQVGFPHLLPANPSMTNHYGQVMSSVLMHPPELNHVLPTHPSASPLKGRPPRADGGPITFGLGEDLRTHPRTVSHLPWPKLTSSWTREA